MASDSHGEGSLGGGGAYGEGFPLPPVLPTPNLLLYDNPTLLALQGTLDDNADGTLGDYGDSPAALGSVDTIPPNTSFAPTDLSSADLDRIAASLNNHPGARHAPSGSHRSPRGASHHSVGRDRRPRSPTTNNAATRKKYPNKARPRTSARARQKTTGARSARSHASHPLATTTRAPHPLDLSSLVGSSSRQPAFHPPPLPLPGRIR